MARPTEGTYHAIYQQRYIDAALGENIKELIHNYSQPLIDFFKSIPENIGDYSYANGKWTIKQLLQHLIDTERIFAYRALRFSRNDQTALAGFDEDNYAENSPVAHRSLKSMIEEFIALRKSTDLLLLSFTEEQLKMSGTASGNYATVNALCFIIFGHLLHHQNILIERYLSSC